MNSPFSHAKIEKELIKIALNNLKTGQLQSKKRLTKQVAFEFGRPYKMWFLPSSHKSL